MENDIDYTGNDDTMPDGKLKCSSTIQPRCTQRAPVDDVPSCKSFCSSSKYFTWKENRECFCKNSDLVKRQQGGSVSGRTNCQGKLGPTITKSLELWFLTLCTSYMFAVQCGMENDIDYTGNDDTMPDGKLKCSSTIQPRCTQRAPVDDVPSCKSFCSSSKYFTWKENRECFCKNSDLVKRQHGGSVSGRTNCQGKLGPTITGFCFNMASFKALLEVF